jgi:hypothetical protein
VGISVVEANVVGIVIATPLTVVTRFVTTVETEREKEVTSDSDDEGGAFEDGEDVVVSGDEVGVSEVVEEDVVGMMIGVDDVVTMMELDLVVMELLSSCCRRSTCLRACSSIGSAAATAANTNASKSLVCIVSFK